MKTDILNLKFISPMLRHMVYDLEKDTGLEFTITSLFRENDPGVHGQIPLRGIDLRCRDEEIGKLLEERVNKKYIYDPKRPVKKCALFHDIGQGPHLHLQCHPNSSKI